MEVDSPALSLRDICHVEFSESSFDSLALPPTIAQNSSDLLIPRAPHLTNDGAYSECPSADYVTASGTSTSSVPSLIYDSFSGSECNPLSASSSYKISELLRSSPGPPLGIWLGERAFSSSSPPLVGLYVDVNMRELALQAKTPSICVNPADVMTDSLMFPSPTMDLSPILEYKSSSPLPNFPADFPRQVLIGNDFPDEAISAIMSVLKTSSVKSEPQPTFIPAESTYPGSDLGILHPRLGNPKAPGPGSHQHKRVPLADLPIPQPQYADSSHALYNYDEYQHATTTYTFAPPVPPGPAAGRPLSPILNAHAGISLEDLRRRADDYRARHEGADLDKNFLQCFAGRLSARGEMLDEHRCYVMGCEQRNKRRDHILVHVGAHVEHRPWMCRHCGMRFLRKNECKRHEAGHGGRKPFSCPICAPYQEKSFVRQDLLKRHLRVAHGAQGAVARKKRTVKDEEEDYWP
ncbi:hypothetical protein K466DRAFT_626854 [Polyporus arcularius HHB13444]|uniref:C2H2-type domain-containing protein n=1 Tax=Polyporus arcularius HHB13444 TaxID=1314778 RepID=A0A5C3PSQ2_9APHY|nr:hypothetical protein K466DRAFT_626854 [Polyporus arcularius HHB13444]